MYSPREAGWSGELSEVERDVALHHAEGVGVDLILGLQVVRHFELEDGIEVVLLGADLTIDDANRVDEELELVADDRSLEHRQLARCELSGEVASSQSPMAFSVNEGDREVNHDRVLVVLHGNSRG